MIALSEQMLWLFWPIVLIVNIGLVGLYCGLEMGVYLANKVRIELDAEAAQRPARILQKMLRNEDNLLAVLLIGTNIHHYLATFAVSTMVVLAGFEKHAEFYTLLIITPLMFVFGDSVPKIVFQRKSGLIFRLAWVLRAADIVFKIIGLSYLVQLVSSGLLRLLGRRKQVISHLGHEGLAAVLAEGRASGTLSLSQTNMAERVMKISEVSVADILQPMDKVISAAVDISHEKFLEIIRQHDYSRIALLGPSGAVAGVVNVFDVLIDREARGPAEFMTQPMLIPADMNVREALLKMQRGRQVFAIAINSDGQHVGLVTIKDFVEEIVGDLTEW